MGEDDNKVTRAHLNAEKTSFQSQRVFNVKELPTSKSYRRQIASNVKELPMSKSFRRQKASDAKELCNNKFRRWLGGGGGMWSCFVSPLHCRGVVLGLGEYRWRHTSFICLFLHALSTNSGAGQGGGGCGHALSHRTLPQRRVECLGRISLATYFFHLPLPSCLVILYSCFQDSATR